LIPAQSNRLLTPQEINLMFSNVIKVKLSTPPIKGPLYMKDLKDAK